MLLLEPVSAGRLTGSMSAVWLYIFTIILHNFGLKKVKG